MKHLFFLDSYYGCNCANVKKLYIYMYICSKLVPFPSFSRQLSISRTKVIIRNVVILDTNSGYSGLIVVSP